MDGIADKKINEFCDYYYLKLVSKLIYKLKRCPQEIRLSPDCGLKNTWEEICVNKQQDYWSGWNLLDDFVRSECFSLVESLPGTVKILLSHEFYPDEMVSAEEDIADKLLGELYTAADNYTSKSIEQYLYNT